MSTAIEHGSTSGSRWLRGRRLKVALWIAVIESLLVVLHVIPKWIAFGIAIAVIVGYFAYATKRSGALRDVGWVAAVSQALVLLFPILLIILGTVALVAVGLLAVIALIYLFTDRG